MLMPSPTDFFSAFPLFYILNLFYSNIRALPTESPYDLFGPSQTDLGSVNIDTTNLDFWHGGEGGLESQSDTFAISSAGASPFSTLDPGSTDLFGSSPPFPNDPFQVTDSGCQAGSMDINEIAQDAFGMSDGQFDVRSELESSINHISKREDLTFGDILSDGEHACPAGKIAACCVLDRVGEVSQGSRRLRPGCIWWGEFHDWRAYIHAGYNHNFDIL